MQKPPSAEGSAPKPLVSASGGFDPKIPSLQWLGALPPKPRLPMNSGGCEPVPGLPIKPPPIENSSPRHCQQTQCM